ncbi:MAG: mannose-6-phosphate isomerase, class I [Rectinemataceae bacterium]
MSNPVRDYAWGSLDGLAKHIGVAVPADRPAAELWMGAHPASPSLLRSPPLRAGGDGTGERESVPVSLDAYIAADPEGCLGPDIGARFGRLPFLFKGLSAAKPLSIQVHPSEALAKEGFARENAAKIPLDAPERVYRDPGHKPELAVALSPFRALCGFRSYGEAKTLLGKDICAFLDFLAAKNRNDSAEDDLKALVGQILSLGPAARSGLGMLAAPRARILASSSDREERKAGYLAQSLIDAYPADPGALMPFLLNLYDLAPGEGLYIPDGVLHAYVEGTALELMANSDNVLRGGLTPKHIDIAELMRALDSATGAATLVRPEIRGTERFWPVPASEFALSAIDSSENSSGEFPGGTADSGNWHETAGPEILLCVSGKLVLAPDGSPSLGLARGESAFVRADCGRYRIEGHGLVYRASVPAGAAT